MCPKYVLRTKPVKNIQLHLQSNLLFSYIEKSRLDLIVQVNFFPIDIKVSSATVQVLFQDNFQDMQCSFAKT